MTNSWVSHNRLSLVIFRMEIKLHVRSFVKYMAWLARFLAMGFALGVVNIQISFYSYIIGLVLHIVWDIGSFIF